MNWREERLMDPPCRNHEYIGTICAGDPHGTGPFCSVATCADCAVKSAGYVQMQTGLPAHPLLTYEDARKAGQ